MTASTQHSGLTGLSLQASDLVSGVPLEVGTGFQALSFKEKHFAGLMDPLVMVDHYTMTEPTFGAHPHAGMSAVSVLFEDSEGSFINRDSLGNNLNLQPGDLYWLKAGSGAVHDESPLPGSRTHGLQLFVNLPARLKHSTPASHHVKAGDIPLLQSPGCRVRVLMGESNGIASARSPALPATLLDGQLEPAVSFRHALSPRQSAWLYTVSGSVELKVGKRVKRIAAGRAIALRNDDSSASTDLLLQGDEKAHFVLIAAEPILESFVQRGPFVMSTPEELEQVAADYAAGKLGSIN